jgi:hypothetical protein
MKQHNDTCVYTRNHSVVMYETIDFEHWTYRGEALPVAARGPVPGVEFRPCVIWNRETGKFVMWHVELQSGPPPNGGLADPGYAIATADSPTGPFHTVSSSTILAGNTPSAGMGDFNMFVDDDGAAYHVRHNSGKHYLLVTKLSDDYLRGVGQPVHVLMPEESEAPVFFKHQGRHLPRPRKQQQKC